MAGYFWRTMSFAPAPPGWELKYEAREGDALRTVPVAGWLTQEQVDDKGNRTGVAAVRVIAAYHRLFAEDSPAEDQEDDEGYMAAELIPADEPGWHVHWAGK